MDINIQLTDGPISDVPKILEPDQTAVTVTQGSDDWVSIGENAIKSGDYKSALSSFDKAISLNEKDEKAWNGKITAQLNLEDVPYDTTLAIAREAVEKVPDNSNLFANLARVYLYRTDNSEAFNAAEKAMELNPENTNAILMMAWAQLYQGAFEEALTTADQILTADPTNPDAAYIKGEAYRELGQTSDAIEAYDKSITVNPSLYCGWWNKISQLIEAGRTDDALSAIEAWKAYSPVEKGNAATQDQVSFLRKIGKQSDGDYQKSLPLWNDYLKIKDSTINRSFKDFVSERVMKLKNEKGEPEVFAELENVLKLYPDVPELWDLNGLFLSYYGHVQEATASYEKALSIDPDYKEDLEAK